MSNILLNIDGAVAMVTISAPDARNAISGVMGAELTRVCAEIDADPAIGAAVLRGAGGTFCSGADTREWVGGSDPAAQEAWTRTGSIFGSIAAFERLRVPTVAAVRGSAVGAGLNLAMAADLRVVAETARLRAGFLAARIHPGGGFFALMGRLAGREAAVAAGCFDLPIDGARAVQLGLAWEAIADEQVEDRALEIAHRVASDPDLGRSIVASLRAALGPPAIPFEASMAVERAPQMWAQRRNQA